MPKFRTMHVNTPEVATHLLANSHQYLTPVGAFLRRYSFDELLKGLYQFIPVIKG